MQQQHRTLRSSLPVGSVQDLFKFNPWRAPGKAPVFDSCGMAGGNYYEVGLKAPSPQAFLPDGTLFQSNFSADKKIDKSSAIILRFEMLQLPYTCLRYDWNLLHLLHHELPLAKVYAAAEYNENLNLQENDPLSNAYYPLSNKLNWSHELISCAWKRIQVKHTVWWLCVTCSDKNYHTWGDELILNIHFRIVHHQMKLCATNHA